MKEEKFNFRLAEKIKEKKINLESKIKYNVLHPEWGRAEFLICPVFKYGKITELHISRAQQDKNERFIMDLKGKGVFVFYIETWRHLNEAPYVWRQFWCKEHKTLSSEVYVPDNTDTIEFGYYFGNSLVIRFVKEEKK